MAGKVITVRGPWKGLNLNESMQSDTNDALALNITYHRGLKERRPGLKYKFTATPGGILHTHTDPSGRLFFLYVYRNDPNYEDVKVAIWQGDTSTPVLSVFNLTSVFGEKAPKRTGRLKASWVSATLAVEKETRFVSVLSTENNTYFFDPKLSESTLQVLDPTTYALAQNAGNIAYWFSPPRGSIAVEHQSRVYYAGFAPGAVVALDRVVPADQTIISEQFLSDNRSELQLTPYQIAYSDEYDPAGIQAHHFFGVEDLDNVTGMASYQENLTILTNKAVYVMTGGTDATFAIVKAAAGVGCVAPRTVVEAGGVLYFMSHDGVYAFGGLGNPGVVKVSLPIDAIFTGEYTSDFVPNQMRTTLANQGWPFKINRAFMEYSHGFYAKQFNQIWFTVPVEGGQLGLLHVTLVFDIVNSAWSVWTTPIPGQTTPQLGMGAVTSAVIAGKDSIFTMLDISWTQATFNEVVAGTLDDYYFGSAVAVTVPYGWMSPRFGGDGVASTTWRNPRFKMLGLGKTPATNGPLVTISGERSAIDWGETEREETYGALATHSESATKNYFLDTMVLDDPTCVLAQIDTQTSTAEVYAKSESCRVGCFDPGVSGRGPLLAVVSYTLEQDMAVVRTK